MRIPDDILEDAIRFRKILAGVNSESISSWNSSIRKVKCELCGSEESSDLEVHHIRERHTANKHDLLNDNSNVHSRANLIVLCDECHDKVHAGQVEVGPLIQTSDGMERTTLQKEQKRSKWSEEEQKQIKEALTKFPKLSMASLSKYLLNQHNIQITGQTLKKMT